MTASDNFHQSINAEEEIPMYHAENLRLECLRFLASLPPVDPSSPGAINTVEQLTSAAAKLFDFITGTDRAALADEAKAAIDKAVR